MTVSQRIQNSRKEKGLTQKELAASIGVATGTIQQYELGKRQPRLEQLQAIATALEVSPAELMGLDELEALGKKTVQSLQDAVDELFPNGGAERFSFSADEKTCDCKLTDEEANVVIKYVALDTRGQETVNVVLDAEYSRAKAARHKSKSPPAAPQEPPEGK